MIIFLMVGVDGNDLVKVVRFIKEGLKVKRGTELEPTCRNNMTMATRLFFLSCRNLPSPCPVLGASYFNLNQTCRGFVFRTSANFRALPTTNSTSRKKKSKNNRKANTISVATTESVSFMERTRSRINFDRGLIQRYGDSSNHVPVMLGEILDVFSSCPGRMLHSFVDCTVGAAGHSSAIIQAHQELQLYVGLDVDPKAHEIAQSHIRLVLDKDLNGANNLRVYHFLKNFIDIKSVLTDIDMKLLSHGVDGILMDLGMSSMQVNDPNRGFSLVGNGPLDMRMNPQATLMAKDILNSWPEAEVGQILREYGEESNWRLLQAKIAEARLVGGLHSTRELVNLVQKVSPKIVGRQGWIKTATRVFQALRIAVNDELKTLKDSLNACFDCLSPGGRLAVISFHSLEDRIVKQTFLDLIGKEHALDSEERSCILKQGDEGNDETWIKQRIYGSNGTILTKRPITPSYEEEQLNRRSRSAKLRVIQKAERKN